MDIRSAFLKDFIIEEIFVKQPLCFEYHSSLYYVFKLSNAPNGLKKTLNLGMIN